MAIVSPLGAPGRVRSAPQGYVHDSLGATRNQASESGGSHSTKGEGWRRYGTIGEDEIQQVQGIEQRDHSAITVAIPSLHAVQRYPEKAKEEERQGVQQAGDTIAVGITAYEILCVRSLG